MTEIPLEKTEEHFEERFKKVEQVFVDLRQEIQNSQVMVDTSKKRHYKTSRVLWRSCMVEV